MDRRGREYSKIGAQPRHRRFANDTEECIADRIIAATKRDQRDSVLARQRVDERHAIRDDGERQALLKKGQNGGSCRTVIEDERHSRFDEFRYAPREGLLLCKMLARAVTDIAFKDHARLQRSQLRRPRARLAQLSLVHRPGG